MLMAHYVPSHLASPLFLTITLRQYCRINIKSPWVCPSALQKHLLSPAPSFIGFRHQSHRWNDKWCRVRLTIAGSGKEASRLAQTGRRDSNQFSSLSCDSQVIVASTFIIFFKLAFQRFSSFHPFAPRQIKTNQKPTWLNNLSKVMQQIKSQFRTQT